jgi:release factor glutamine methyltransferase
MNPKVNQDAGNNAGCSIYQSILSIENQLTRAGVEQPRHEAEYILAEILDIPPAQLVLKHRLPLPDCASKKIEEAARRRKNNEPLQYIFGRAYFMDFWLHVGRGVLIPRPETELLVEKVCKTAPANGKICELGTGSGAISLAIAAKRQDLQIAAVDISPVALEYAEKNRRQWGINHVTFFAGDLFSAFTGKTFDYIVANLPYIGAEEYEKLPEEIREFEPESALLADARGTAIIERALNAAATFLNPGGQIIFEIGENQGVFFRELLCNLQSFDNIRVLTDYSNRDRFITAELLRN